MGVRFRHTESEMTLGHLVGVIRDKTCGSELGKDKELKTEVVNWIGLFHRDSEEGEGQDPRIIV